MTPAPCGAAPCQAGTVPACVNLCVTPIGEGKTCSPDACDPNGTCEVGLTCHFTAAGNGTYTCQPIPGGGGPFATCSGNFPGAETCQNGLYCRSAQGNCPGVKTTECAFEGVEGAACDSTWLFPQCLPCGPGLACVGPAGKTCTNTEASPCTCRESCTTTATCPCDGSVCPTTPPQGVAGIPEPIGYCYMCDQLGDTGCSDQVPCCDGSECYVPSSSASASRCCMAGGKQCTTNADCCPEVLANGTPVSVICGPSYSGAENTCQSCHNVGSFCLQNEDCCETAMVSSSGTTTEVPGECLAGTCRGAQGNACSSNSDCATGTTCNCNHVCEPPIALGSACTPQASCCSSSGDQYATCGLEYMGNGNVCCVSNCGICTVDTDCCQPSVDKSIIKCEAVSSGSKISRCCGIAEGTSLSDAAPCTSNTDCCNGYACVAGRCNFNSGNMNEHQLCSSGQPEGCAPSGTPCDDTAPCCSGGFCTGGVCVTPSPHTYHLRSYLFAFFDSVTVSTNYDYVLPTGTPIDVSAAGLAVVATQSPSALYGIRLLNAAPWDVLDFSFSLPTPPRSVDVFLPTGSSGALTTFDAVLGETSQGAWYQFVGGALESVPDNPAIGSPFSGSVVSTSPSPSFDQGNHEVAFATATNLYYVDTSTLPLPTIEGTSALSPYGAAVEVSAGTGSVWAVVDQGTGGTLVSFDLPTLTTPTVLASLSAPPAGVGVGEILGLECPCDRYIMVVTHPTATQDAQLLTFPNGGGMPTVVNSFTGDPVKLRITADPEDQGTYYAWVVTRSPNQLLVFNVLSASGPAQVIPLPGEPITMNVGLQIVTPTCMPPCYPATQSGFVHTVLSEP
jgi:hypothetical protein